MPNRVARRPKDIRSKGKREILPECASCLERSDGPPSVEEHEGQYICSGCGTVLGMQLLAEENCLRKNNYSGDYLMDDGLNVVGRVRSRAERNSLRVLYQTIRMLELTDFESAIVGLFLILMEMDDLSPTRGRNKKPYFRFGKCAHAVGVISSILVARKRGRYVSISDAASRTGLCSTILGRMLRRVRQVLLEKNLRQEYDNPEHENLSSAVEYWLSLFEQPQQGADDTRWAILPADKNYMRIICSELLPVAESVFPGHGIICTALSIYLIAKEAREQEAMSPVALANFAGVVGNTLTLRYRCWHRLLYRTFLYCLPQLREKLLRAGIQEKSISRPRLPKVLCFLFDYMFFSHCESIIEDVDSESLVNFKRRPKGPTQLFGLPDAVEAAIKEHMRIAASVEKAVQARKNLNENELSGLMGALSQLDVAIHQLLARKISVDRILMCSQSEILAFEEGTKPISSQINDGPELLPSDLTAEEEDEYIVPKSTEENVLEDESDRNNIVPLINDWYGGITPGKIDEM